jgi:two-component system response regulator AtoC
MPEQATAHLSNESASAPSTSADTLIFGSSLNRAMRVLENVATEIAATNIPVLIAGESGTGKQVLARRIHEASPRRNAPFLKIVCATVTTNTLGPQLRLGDRRAAFGGTAIFDEVGDLDRDSQRRLLHSLPDGEGTSSKETLSARVISTTSQCLEDEVRTGRFRNDLYHRLNGVCLRIPPLRERREDISPLMEFFLAKHAERFARPCPSLTAQGQHRLEEHSWTGNLRELENVAMKIVALGDEELALADLTAQAAPLPVSPTIRGEHSLKAAAKAASREAEREMILKALSRTRWNRKRAAQELQISYKSLLYKLKQIGLPGPEGE